MRAAVAVRERPDDQLHPARRRVRADELPAEHAGETANMGGKRRAVAFWVQDRVHAQGTFPGFPILLSPPNPRTKKSTKPLLPLSPYRQFEKKEEEKTHFSPPPPKTRPARNSNAAPQPTTSRSSCPSPRTPTPPASAPTSARCTMRPRRAPSSGRSSSSAAARSSSCAPSSACRPSRATTSTAAA